MLSWPDPPDPARIEYVSTISSSRDLTGPPTFGEKVKEFIGLEGSAETHSIVQPADVAVTADGSILYVSDFASGLVHIFDRARGEARYFGADTPLARPFGLALDSSGNLYVAEQEKQQIRIIDPNGKTLRFFRSDRLIRPVDIELDEARNRLYVADGSHQNSKEHYVRIFDLEGNYVGEVGEGRGTAEGELLFPTYLAIDGAGSVYVADTMNSRISVFDAEGGFVRTIGSRGDGFGLFDKPKGVALDSFGNVYVVDSSWSNVQIFGPEGDVLLYFGGRGGYPGLLRNPTGIAIANGDNTIYVGDYLNRRVTIYRLVNTKPGDGLSTAPSAATEVPKE
ncbi:MAG: hypothetical protein JRE57_13250 [Deltaproteobacteria bacterium]|nr:hypothetical protein [Deltaproteobacteria bacterium]